MNERDSMQSFYGSVANGFTNGFSLGVQLSCIKTLFKNAALVIRRRQTLRTSAVASAMVTSGLMGGVILGTIHAANYLVQVHVGAHIGGFLYLLLRDDDPQGSPRFPKAPAQGNQEGQKLDMCNFPKSLDTVTGDWVTAEPSCGEYLEGEDLH